jgi:hypothetical protein
MTEKSPPAKKPSADWFARGILTKLGDSFDRWTGRQWAPSNSLATSDLIESIKRILDSEAKDVPGKGTVVPHNIKLKMQWDKFSDDSEGLEALRNELLTAAVDHINDSLYYTFAPVSLEIKPDYFVEGVKLYVSFDKFTDEEQVEQNVTVPSLDVAGAVAALGSDQSPSVEDVFLAQYQLNGNTKETTFNFPAGQRRSVGRASTNDLALDDSSVSNLHASLAIGENGDLCVADTGSTNGTFVSGERIAYGKAVSVRDGDSVKFGVVEVRFERLAQPATAKDDNVGESGS